ncbi:hypothetical protein MC885_019853 [Smutsia gigantea]|nr:hypothetical protein MC885_019853 [Smutsia gigantea]
MRLAGDRPAAAAAFPVAPPDGARLEVAELDWLKSGRGSGLKSGSISTTWSASAMVTAALRGRAKKGRVRSREASGREEAIRGWGARSVPPAHAHLEEGAAEHSESPELRGSINNWSPPVPLRGRDGGPEAPGRSCGQGRRTEARKVLRELPLPPVLATLLMLEHGSSCVVCASTQRLPAPRRRPAPD